MPIERIPLADKAFILLDRSLTRREPGQPMLCGVVLKAFDDPPTTKFVGFVLDKARKPLMDHLTGAIDDLPASCNIELWDSIHRELTSFPTTRIEGMSIKPVRESRERPRSSKSELVGLLSYAGEIKHDDQVYTVAWRQPQSSLDDPHAFGSEDVDKFMAQIKNRSPQLAAAIAGELTSPEQPGFKFIDITQGENDPTPRRGA